MKKEKGFTLVELIAVIMLLALLLVLVVPNVAKLADRSNTSLKDSKIRTIETVGEKYGNSLINRFQNCINTATETELKNDCSVSVNELVMNGLIEGEDDDYNIFNPETKEPFKGKVLLCYNPSTISINASYVEDDSQYKCDAVDVETGAALNLSAISGKGYVGGDPIEVNIIKSGIERNGFRCESSDESLATCDTSSSTKLVINVTAQPFTEPQKEVKITLYGKTKNEELKQTYTLVIYSPSLEIDVPDDDAVCLPQENSTQYGLLTQNAGNLSVESSDDDILKGDINQTILTVTGGIKPGEATLYVREANGHIERTLKKRVYSLMPEGGIPSDLLLGNSETIKLNYGGNDTVKVTSDTPDIIKVSSSKQREGASITLTDEDSFTIRTVGTGDGHITITGNPCGQIEKTITVSNLYIKDSEAKIYIGGDSFKTEVIAGSRDTYTCSSSDNEVATCKVVGTKVEVIPKQNAGLVTITVKGANGGQDTIKVDVIKTTLELVDDSNNPVSQVCSSVNETTNDKEVNLKYENIGAFSISSVSDSKLGLVSFGDNHLILSKNYLNDTSGLTGYKHGYNTGVVNIEVHESNGNVTAPLDYYIYDIDAPLEYAEVIAGETTTIDLANYASGPLSATVSDPSIADILVSNPSTYNYGLNAKNDSKLIVNPLKTGETTVTIRGEKCGNVTFRLIVKGKTFTLPIRKGTYTDYVGDKDEDEISCSTSGSGTSCEVTFPEFKVKNGFVMNGYSTAKDGVSTAYKAGDKITLTESNSGTIYYANAIVKANPVCEFRKPLNSINAEDTTYATLICKDPSMSSSKLTIDDFEISNPDVAEIISVGEPIEIVDEYGREGYTYRIGFRGGTFGNSFNLTLKEGVFVDQFEKKNATTDFGSILIGKYSSYKFWYVGKNNPQDAVAVMYINEDLPDELAAGPDDYYTIILYGNGATKDFNTGDEGDIPPWILAGYQEFVSNVIVSDGITEIGSATFYSLYNLQNVTLPEGLSRIGASAFSFDKKLQSVTFPTTLTAIGDQSFEMCEKLEEARFNSGLETVGAAAFRNTSLNEVFIPNTVKEIGSYAFYYDVDEFQKLGTITKLEFEEGSQLSTITNSVFTNSRITSLHIPASVGYIGYDAFSQYDYYKNNLQTLTFEEGSKLTWISEYAFAFNNLSSLTLPDSVRQIDNFAFDGIDATSIDLGPNVQILGVNFALGNNIREYNVDENNETLTSLDGVIYSKDLSKLVKVPVNYYSTHNELTVPNTVTEIEPSAFGGWVKIEDEKKEFVLNLPSSITNMNIQENFRGTIISEFNIDNDLYTTIDGVLFSKDLTTIYRLPTHYKEDSYIIPDSVTNISSFFAYANTGVKSITIPETVNTIDSYAFTNDPNVSFKYIYLNVLDEVEIEKTALLTFYSRSEENASYLKNVYVKSTFMANKLKDLYNDTIKEFNIEIIGE